MLLPHGAPACALLAAACVKPVVPQTSYMTSSPPSRTSQPGDRHVLDGEWEYIDGAVDGAVSRLILDKQGNGHYSWKDGRFETHTLIGHTWRGVWFQKGNDRDGGFTVDFSPDFSTGEGCWWYNRIGADYAPTPKGGKFHLNEKTALTRLRNIPPAP